MKRRHFHYLIYTLLSVFTYGQLYAQESAIEYVLGKSETVIDNSQYNSFLVMDIREDTAQMGFTMTGAFNSIAILEAKEGLNQQVADFFSSAINYETASKGELLIQLRQWQFSETSISGSQQGFCHLCISFFAKKDMAYHPLGTINKRVKVVEIDVSRAIQREVKFQLSLFTMKMLKATPEYGIPYSYSQLSKIEDYEKDTIPIYNGVKWKDGLYKTFHSFKHQKPDAIIEVKLTDGKIGKVMYMNSEGKFKKWTGKYHYAIVYQGEPYIYTGRDYYPLKMENRNFQFIGLMDKIGNPMNLSFGIMYGGAGAGITPTAREWYLVEINHLDGSFNYQKSGKQQD